MTQLLSSVKVLIFFFLIPFYKTSDSSGRKVASSGDFLELWWQICVLPSFSILPNQGKTTPSPHLGADPSSSMCGNISRASPQPCSSSHFISAALADFLFCKHLWLKAKCDFGYCPQDFLHFPPFLIPEILPWFLVGFFFPAVFLKPVLPKEIPMIVSCSSVMDFHLNC